MDGHLLAERYAEAHNPPWDWDEMAEIVHPDFVEDWPQSNERIVGLANKRAILENYPGGLPDRGVSIRRILGEAETSAAAAGPLPFLTFVRVHGGGDSFTFEGTARYIEGEITHLIGIIQIRDQKVWRVTSYFAPPFASPDWRSQWVQPMPPPTAQV